MKVRFRDKRRDRLKLVVRNVITEKDIANQICDRPVGWCYSHFTYTYFHPKHVMSWAHGQ